MRRLVTQPGGQRSCGASSPDWPVATAGPARNWRCRGSNPGSPAWPASGPALRLWTPFGRRLSRNTADAGGCGHRGGTGHCNTGTCGRRWNSSADAKCTASHALPATVWEEDPPPAPPRRRPGRRRRKKSFARSFRRRSNASAIRRSSRPFHRLYNAAHIRRLARRSSAVAGRRSFDYHVITRPLLMAQRFKSVPLNLFNKCSTLVMGMRA